MSALNLRLPESLHLQVRELAERDKVSINQFVTLAVAEKVAALRTLNYIEQRGQQGSRGSSTACCTRLPRQTESLTRRIGCRKKLLLGQNESSLSRLMFQARRALHLVARSGLPLDGRAGVVDTPRSSSSPPAGGRGHPATKCKPPPGLTRRRTPGPAGLASCSPIRATA